MKPDQSPNEQPPLWLTVWLPSALVTFSTFLFVVCIGLAITPYAYFNTFIGEAGMVFVWAFYGVIAAFCSLLVSLAVMISNALRQDSTKFLVALLLAAIIGGVAISVGISAIKSKPPPVWSL